MECQKLLIHPQLNERRVFLGGFSTKEDSRDPNQRRGGLKCLETLPGGWESRDEQGEKQKEGEKMHKIPRLMFRRGKTERGDRAHPKRRKG
jgi:hypothetical protein